MSTYLFAGVYAILTRNSHHGHSGVNCSIKANEGLLYFLDKSLIFVPKPSSYIQLENVAIITMSRVGGAVSASRTFDITVTLKAGMGEHQFSNINRCVSLCSRNGLLADLLQRGTTTS